MHPINCYIGYDLVEVRVRLCLRPDMKTIVWGMTVLLDVSFMKGGHTVRFRIITQSITCVSLSELSPIFSLSSAERVSVRRVHQGESHLLWFSEGNSAIAYFRHSLRP